MNYKDYAKTLFSVFVDKSESDFDSFFEKFIGELKQKQRIALLPKILKEVEKLIAIDLQKNKTEIVLRESNELEKFQETIKTLSDKFNFDDLKVVENKNIIGGFVLRNSKHIFDNSYKKRLVKLYQQLVK